MFRVRTALTGIDRHYNPRGRTVTLAITGFPVGHPISDDENKPFQQQHMCLLFLCSRTSNGDPCPHLRSAHDLQSIFSRRPRLPPTAKRAGFERSRRVLSKPPVPKQLNPRMLFGVVSDNFVPLNRDGRASIDTSVLPSRYNFRAQKSPIERTTCVRCASLISGNIGSERIRD